MESITNYTEIVFLVVENLRTKKPIIAEIKEPISMPIFAESIYAGLLSNAKLATKIAIVNPIPAKNETPII